MGGGLSKTPNCSVSEGSCVSGHLEDPANEVVSEAVGSDGSTLVP